MAPEQGLEPRVYKMYYNVVIATKLEHFLWINNTLNMYYNVVG